MGSWNTSARRVVIHSASYLGFEGEVTAGGRQRFIRDIAAVVRKYMKRDVVVVQRASRAFERECPHGIPVIGLKAPLGVIGDPIHAFLTQRLIRPGDRVLYASGEDAWPFFESGSKAIQHGVWWDGPKSRKAQHVQRIRALACVEKTDSTLCVDTNFINWLRCQGAAGFRLCVKCFYLPNYADIQKPAPRRRANGQPLKIICARRYEEKRGFELLIDALGDLRQRGVDVTATLYAVGGSKLNEIIKLRGLDDRVVVLEDTMDGILKKYRESDAAVVPTLWSEGTSLACVEAICSGLPVVATTVGGLGNLIVPGFNGFLVSPTPAAIADALESISSPITWNAMHEAALSMSPALEKEAWEKSVLKWLNS